MVSNGPLLLISVTTTVPCFSLAWTVRDFQQTLLTTAKKLVGVKCWGQDAKEAAFG
jgi:hypothetical protein